MTDYRLGLFQVGDVSNYKLVFFLFFFHSTGFLDFLDVFWLSNQRYVAFELAVLAVGAGDGAVIDVDPGHAPVVAEAAIPALRDVVALVDFFAPTGEDDDVELAYPFAREAELVVLAVAVWGESIGYVDVGFAAVDAYTAYFDGVLMLASKGIG